MSHLLDILNDSQDDMVTLIEREQLSLDDLIALKPQIDQIAMTEPSRAVALAQVAQEMGDALPDTAASYWGNWALGNAYLINQQRASAREAYAVAYNGFLNVNDVVQAARCAVGYVGALAYTGYVEDAIGIASEAIQQLSTRSELPDLQRTVWLHNNLGIAYDIVNRYEDSLNAYEDGIRIAESHPPLHPIIPHVQVNRACALMSLNTFHEAITVSQTIEPLLIEQTAYNALHPLYINWALMLIQLELYTEASNMLDKTEDVLERFAPDPSSIALINYCRVRLNLFVGDENDSQALIDMLYRVREMLMEHGPILEAGVVALDIAYLQFDAGDTQSHLSALSMANDWAEQNGNRTLQWRVAFAQGQFAESREDKTAALIFYEQAIEQIERLQNSIQIESFLTFFLVDKLVVYQTTAMLYIEDGQLDAALTTLERSRAQWLSERLSDRLSDATSRFPDIDDDVTRRLTNQIRSHFDRLKELERQIITEQNANGLRKLFVPTIEPKRETWKQIQLLEEEIYATTRQLESHAPLFSPYATGFVPTHEQIRDCLNTETLFYYVITTEQVGVFVINAHKKYTYYALADTSTIEQLQSAFLDALNEALALLNRHQQSNRLVPMLLDEINEIGEALYSLLIKPIESHVQKEVVIIPDGILHHLPFHALWTGTAYMVEQTPISYVPSISVYYLCQQTKHNNNGKALIMGYGGRHLHAISDEISALSTQLSEQIECEQKVAEIAYFLNEAHNYNIIHLASHALFRQDRAMLSGFEFVDGRLSLAEITRLHLNAELVTLSACETAQGTVRGSNLISLAGGFMAAGARSLLTTLWQIEDGTTVTWMSIFYKALLDGYSRINAVQLAYQQLLEIGRTDPEKSMLQHPAYWASYILIGDISPLLSARKSAQRRENE